MNPFNEEEFLRDKARALSSGLFIRLDEFVNDFPGGAPGDLITLVKSFLKEIDSQLDSTSNKKVLWGYFYLIEELSRSLDWLDNAHTAQTPRGLVQLLEEIASTLHPDSKLLVAPTREINYSIIDLIPYYIELAEDSLSAKSSHPLLASLPKQLYLVRFPRVERENILNHATFGHEFGHPIADEFIEAQEQKPEYARRLERLAQSIQSDDDLKLELEEEGGDEVTRSKLLTGLVDQAREIYRRALEELASDCVGVCLFGPSALFASLDSHLQSSLDEAPSDPEYYPPSRFRLRLMTQMVRDQGYIDAMTAMSLPPGLEDVRAAVLNLFRYLDGIAANTADEDSLQNDPLVRIAYDWVRETLSQAIQHAKDRLSSMCYSSSVAQSELPTLLERIAVDVPPNEVGQWPKLRPANWRSAILASWLTAITASSDTARTAAERAKRIKTIQKLALKGIEYALLQRKYLNFKQHQG